MASVLVRRVCARPPAPCVSVRARHTGQQRLKESKFPVILTQAVPGVGDKGEEVLVRRGYARNFLLPQRLAVYCTPESRRHYAPLAESIDYEARARNLAASQALKRLDKVRVTVKRQRVGERLHAPVDAPTIARQLWRQCRILIAPEKVLLDAALTAYGEHAVNVIADEHGNVAPLHVDVVPR